MHTVWQILEHNRSPAELIKRANTKEKHLCIFLLLKLFYIGVCSQIMDIFFWCLIVVQMSGESNPWCNRCCKLTAFLSERVNVNAKYQEKSTDVKYFILRGK